MASSILIDELHLTIRIPNRLTASEAAAIRRTLDGHRFRSRLRQAIRTVFGRFSTLGKARVSVSR
jgi:hypothetical protein